MTSFGGENVRAISTSIILLIVLLLGVGAVSAATWTVDATAYADDTNCDAASRQCHTIQAAVNAASPLDTINVAAGIYDEQIVIDGKPLTVTGAGDTTIIRPSTPSVLSTLYVYPAGTLWPGTTLAGVVLVKNVDSVTVQGLKIDGSDVTSLPAGANRLSGIIYGEAAGLIDTVTIDSIKTAGYADRTYVIDVSAVGTSRAVEISNNHITDYARTAIQAQGASMNANIHHNVIVGPGTIGPANVPNGIVFIKDAVGSASYNTISSMHYSGTGSRSGGLMAYGTTASAGVVFSNNEVYDADDAVIIAANAANVQVIQNNFHDTPVGVQIENLAHDNLIANNTITNSNIVGIRFEGALNPAGAGTPPGANNVAHDNVLTGYVLGVANYDAASTVDASNNWWGTPMKSAVEASFTGSVTYAPWYLDAGKTTLSDSDMTGPTVALSTASGQTAYRPDHFPAVLTATFGDTYGLDSAVIPTITIGSNPAAAMTATADPNVWTYSWASASVGIYAISATAKDAVGNDAQAATGVTSIVVDDTGAVYGALFVTPSYNDGSLYISGLSNITMEVSDPESGIVDCYYSIDGGSTYGTASGTYADGNCTFLNAPTDSATSIRVGAETGAAAATWSAAYPVVFDITAPTILVHSPVAGASYQLPLYANATMEDPIFSTGGVEFWDEAMNRISYGSAGVGFSSSGYTVPDGLYTATYTARDHVGNVRVAEIGVFTVDTAAPVIAAMSDIPAEAMSPAGTVVTYAPPGVTDNLDPAVVAACDLVSGSTFPLGNTTVTCTASDAAGNAATPGSFVVSVADHAPPVTTATPVDYTFGTWVNATAVVIDFACADAASTCSVRYCVTNDTTCEPFTVGTQVTVAGDGIWTVQYSSIDAAGNVEQNSAPNLVLIDTNDEVETTPGDLAGLVIAGVFDITTNSTNTTIAVTRDTVIGIDMGDGNTEIVLPAGLVISGPAFNIGDLTGSMEDSSIISNLPANYAFDGEVIEWGVAGLGLTFTPAVTIEIYVGTEYDGRTLYVLRSVTGSTWLTDGLVDTSCVVSSGICTFRTTKASYYTTTTYSTATSGRNSGGGGGTCASGYTRIDGACVKQTTRAAAPTPAPTPAPTTETVQEPVKEPVTTAPVATPVEAPASGDLLTGRVTDEGGVSTTTWVWLGVLVGVIALGLLSYAFMRKR